MTHEEWKKLQVWKFATGALLVPAILVLLQPFNVRLGGFNPVFVILLLGYGLVIDGVLLVVERISWMMGNSRSWKTENWNTVFQLAAVPAACYGYYSLLHRFNDQWAGVDFPAQTFLDFAPRALILTSFWAATYLGYRLLKTGQEPSARDASNESIVIRDSYGRDGVISNLENLILMKSCDNYVDVSYLDDEGRLRTKLIRTSLKKLEQQLPSFFRCHQSYLINMDCVRAVERRDKRHFVTLGQYPGLIPVARSKVSTLRDLVYGHGNSSASAS